MSLSIAPTDSVLSDAMATKCLMRDGVTWLSVKFAIKNPIRSKDATRTHREFCEETKVTLGEVNNVFHERGERVNKGRPGVAGDRLEHFRRRLGCRFADNPNGVKRELDKHRQL
jgi:hypothetical protein